MLGIALFHCSFGNVQYRICRDGGTSRSVLFLTRYLVEFWIAKFFISVFKGNFRKKYRLDCDHPLLTQEPVILILKAKDKMVTALFFFSDTKLCLRQSSLTSREATCCNNTWVYCKQCLLRTMLFTFSALRAVIFDKCFSSALTVCVPRAVLFPMTFFTF